MSKTLVAYFSCTGTTRGVAEELVQKTGADLVEIQPKTAYSSADLNWRDKSSRTSMEMRDKDARPEILADNIDTTKYSTIYLGFPIWWYIAPSIINTWLEAHSFNNCKIILFATSGGSGFGQAKTHLELSAPSAEIVEGKVVRSKHDIDSLIKLV